MALKDLFHFFDSKLEDTFNSKPRDAVKARAGLLRGIDNTKAQFEAGKTKVPNRWWSVSNGVVAFSPKVGSTPLVINGQTTNHLPAERFPEFLEKMRAEVEAGEFDAMIEAIENGTGNAGSSVAVKPTRKRAASAAADDPNHPKFTNPAWSSMSSGEKIKAGLAYKNSKA